MTGDSFELEGEYVVVTLRLKVWEARRLSTIFMAAGARGSASRMEARRWRVIGRRLKKITELPRGFRRRIRPSSRYQSHIDMDHVLHGSSPYPVLSVRDMHTVWPDLEAQGRSAREIAERLHVHPRTVVRWRAAKREGDSGSGTEKAPDER